MSPLKKLEDTSESSSDIANSWNSAHETSFGVHRRQGKLHAMDATLDPKFTTIAGIFGCLFPV